MRHLKIPIFSLKEGFCGGWEPVTCVDPEETLRQTSAHFENSAEKGITGWKTLNRRWKDSIETLLSELPKPIHIKNDYVLGLEIEAENLNPGWHIYLPGVWMWDKDSSLRNNGVEFRSYPIPYQSARTALAMLWSCFNTWQHSSLPDFSWRTSIHVHIGVRNRTITDIIKILFTYMVFEDLLFDFAKPERKQSIYCVPITSTEFHELIYPAMTKGPSYAVSMINAWMKYSALNLLPIQKLGTIEFRHLEGTADSARITNWINLLIALTEYSVNANESELIQEIAQLNTTSRYQAFKDKVFGYELSNLLGFADIERKMCAGVIYAKECLTPHIDSFKNKVTQHAPMLAASSRRTKMSEEDQKYKIKTKIQTNAILEAKMAAQAHAVEQLIGKYFHHPEFDLPPQQPKPKPKKAVKKAPVKPVADPNF